MQTSHPCKARNKKIKESSFATVNRSLLGHRFDPHISKSTVAHHLVTGHPYVISKHLADLVGGRHCSFTFIVSRYNLCFCPTLLFLFSPSCAFQVTFSVILLQKVSKAENLLPLLTGFHRWKPTGRSASVTAGPYLKCHQPFSSKYSKNNVLKGKTEIVGSIPPKAANLKCANVAVTV